jgi:RNA polymerase sigma-70 factor (ECF subfamily)
MRAIEADLMGSRSPESADAKAEPRARDDQRVTAMVREHHAFVWRLLLRLGVPASGAEDVVQQVFLVAMRRVSEIAPGSEKSFLFGTALRAASDDRRLARQREVPSELSDTVASENDPEEQAEARRRRERLQHVLSDLPLELRTVFVLFELEQMTKSEVAELLGLPVGTAVSRLRRARQLFRESLERRGYAQRGEP